MLDLIPAVTAVDSIVQMYHYVNVLHDDDDDDEILDSVMR